MSDRRVVNDSHRVDKRGWDPHGTGEGTDLNYKDSSVNKRGRCWSVLFLVTGRGKSSHLMAGYFSLWKENTKSSAEAGEGCEVKRV